ncbi:MAG: MFS transporter [Balneolaceae bacterium]|nr:MAG: MFS transporter [Balneolaceae bacterium]
METENRSRSLLRDKNLYVIFGITLTSIMGVSSIAPALPSISRTLEVSADQIGLLITFFTIPGIMFTPLLGILADRYGRKRILIPSLFLFGIAGTACGFSSSFEQLLFYRFLQGLGSASLGVLNLTMLGDLYNERERVTALGYNGGILSVGTALYPAIGGTLAILGWNYPFFLTLFAIPVGLFAAFALDTASVSNSLELNRYFKQIGSALKSRFVAGLFASMFLTFFILYGGYITFFTILLDEKFGLSAFGIGILLSGSSVITAIASSTLGRLTLRFHEKYLILTAAILYTLFFLSLPMIRTVWGFLIPIAFFGFAQGINIPSVLNLITGYAAKEYRAAFLSVNWMIMRMGQALGPWVLGFLYLWFGVNGTFYGAAFMAFLFICVVLLLIFPGDRRFLTGVKIKE